jgi:coenzyme PQQ precursor peptide PqqA
VVALAFNNHRRFKSGQKGNTMAWTTPILVEICIGLEINGYLPAEF